MGCVESGPIGAPISIAPGLTKVTQKPASPVSNNTKKTLKTAEDLDKA